MAMPSPDRGSSSTPRSIVNRYDLRPPPALQLVRPPATPNNLIFVYRSNDVYDGALPQIAKTLQRDGYTVHRWVFPRDVAPEEICEALKQLQEECKGAVVFADGTVQSNWPKDVPVEFRPGAGLNELFHRATIDTIRDRFKIPAFSWKKSEHEIVAIKALLARALHRIKPDQVIIFPHHLSEHPPFAVDPSLSQPAEVVRSWVRDAGVPAKHIRICSDLRTLDREHLESCKRVVCIADRHLLTTGGIHSMIRDCVARQLEEMLDEADLESHHASRLSSDDDHELWLERHQALRLGDEEAEKEWGCEDFDPDSAPGTVGFTFHEAVESEVLYLKELLGLSEPLDGGNHTLGDDRFCLWWQLPIDSSFQSAFDNGIFHEGEFAKRADLVGGVCNGIAELLEAIASEKGRS